MAIALPEWARQLAPVDMDGAAIVLGVSRRFLIDVLKEHPHYERRGAKYVFYPEHIAKLKYIVEIDKPATRRAAVLAFVAKRLSAAKIAAWEQFFAENESGHVYIIRCGDRVKIGFTMKIRDRMRVLRTACPYPIEEVAVFSGNRNIERFLHAALGEWRRHGEWFECSGDVKALVDEMESI